MIYMKMSFQIDCQFKKSVSVHAMKVCIKVTYGDVSEKELQIYVQIWRLF